MTAWLWIGAVTIVLGAASVWMATHDQWWEPRR